MTGPEEKAESNLGLVVMFWLAILLAMFCCVLGAVAVLT